MSPLQRLREDRARARALQDPYADLCALATVDVRSHPQVRTLVLRDLDNGLAVFVNATSPKWRTMNRVAAMAIGTGTPNQSGSAVTMPTRLAKQVLLVVSMKPTIKGASI